MDACSSLTLLDAAVAAEVGVKLTGRIIKLMVADGHEIVGGPGIVEKLAVECEEPPGHVAAAKLPLKLKGRLQALGLAEWCVFGFSTLEILGFEPSTAKGKEEKVEHLRYNLNRLPAANVS